MDNLARLSARIPADLMERLKIRAARERRTAQEIIVDALQAYLRTALPGKEVK
jgi:hypothetical protein